MFDFDRRKHNLNNKKSFIQSLDLKQWKLILEKSFNSFSSKQKNFEKHKH